MFFLQLLSSLLTLSFSFFIPFFIHSPVYYKGHFVKDTDKQPGEEVRSRRVLSVGASVPMALECATLCACGCVYQPRESYQV